MRAQLHTHTHTRARNSAHRVFTSQNGLIMLTLLKFTLSPPLECSFYVKGKRKLGIEVYDSKGKAS